MPLKIGGRIGPYEILGLLGVGGMGEVYRARDMKLNRDVALKVLIEVFAQDAERMARFEREAQMLASLNHSNIASIYGLEEAGCVRALVMELVEGPTLAERLAQGTIPVDEALPIARQIAQALETAHEQGIVHRDLKPANVKLRPDGAVKILDFGLAKAMETNGVGVRASGAGSAAGLTQSPTLTEIGTQAGIILGTAELESALRQSGLSYVILRPTVLFGQEDILVNNIAWMLRRFPTVLPKTGAPRQSNAVSALPHFKALRRFWLILPLIADILFAST